MSAPPIVILGTGLAGYGLAREFRKHDKSTPVTLVTRDGGIYYSKPTLSNAFAHQKTTEALAISPAEKMAADLNLDVRTHTTATRLDLDRRQLTTDLGDIAYERLVFAQGADPIRLPLAGDGADAVCSVNDLDDYARLRARLTPGAHVLILGAGLIGCEFANDLISGGVRVTVTDIAAQPLGRLLPPRTAALLADALAAIGVTWRLGTSVTTVDRIATGPPGGHTHGPVRAHFADGTVQDTDLVLSAVGLRPRVTLAATAGVAVNRGIVTNRLLATRTDGLYALGDCAEVEGLVLPFVMPILHAARALAMTLAGTPTSVVYPVMPVVVKTPALPTVVCPPLPGVTGEWEETIDGTTARATFRDTTGQLRGFILTGAATGERIKLAQGMTAWLE